MNKMFIWMSAVTLIILFVGPPFLCFVAAYQLFIEACNNEDFSQWKYLLWRASRKPRESSQCDDVLLGD